MASLKSPFLVHMSLLLFRPSPISQSLSFPSKINKFSKKSLTIPFFPSQSFSTTSTPYPLQYEMIVSHPVQPQLSPIRRRQPRQLTQSKPENSTNPDEESSSELGFDNWVDRKLASKHTQIEIEDDAAVGGDVEEMDKSKRKYYNKRRKRMYGGTDSDDEDSRKGEEFVEMKPEVVELRTLHKREEELYFYDMFAYPWEKDKHYKMVYQLEKKYFPDHCFDKAFVEPGATNSNIKKTAKRRGSNVRSEKTDEVGDGRDADKRLIFFEEGKEDSGMGLAKDASKDVSERKVEEFFKCLKKVPNKDVEFEDAEPYLLTRSKELPPRWDGPNGTMVLINKPKGWTSFTVCGKLRRLVNVKKVGHAGTLDPMATGLLIVCVGKATKVVDKYQGMIKGYSGVFRLGEATSTWDADSPVIQREPWEHIKDEDIKKAVASFCGEIWQVPPMFSAIKVGGEKMYEKARRGESIELSPRRISIFKFDIERSLEDRQNLIFRVTCSKGTYIRSLCADLGKALGSCAHLTALRRDSIGEYSADDAWDFSELEKLVTKLYF